MASSEPKRQRTNTLGAVRQVGSTLETAALHAAPPPVLKTPSQLWKDLHTLDVESLRTLLFHAAVASPDITNEVYATINAKRTEQSQRIITFDQYSGSVWRAINTTYSSLSGSKQYDVAGDVVDQITDIIAKIAAEASEEFASFGTKRSGIETLRKIGKSISLGSGDTLDTRFKRTSSITMLWRKA